MKLFFLLTLDKIVTFYISNSLVNYNISLTWDFGAIKNKFLKERKVKRHCVNCSIQVESRYRKERTIYRYIYIYIHKIQG